MPLNIQAINKDIYSHYTYIQRHINKSTSFIIHTITYQQRKREGYTNQNKWFSNFKGFYNEHGYISYFNFIFCFHMFNKYMCYIFSIHVSKGNHQQLRS